MAKTKQLSTSLDTNESYWSLGCIFGFVGIPGIILGNQLAITYGVAVAITSILIGNFVLWIFGSRIVVMAQGKNQVFDNIKKHFGKTSSLLAILLFTLAFLIWYTVQLSSTVSRTCQVFQWADPWKVGLALGIVVAILSSRGFKIIKWACLAEIIILAGITLYFIAAHRSSIHSTESSYFSFPAILSIIIPYLAGTVALPTFFRHARSRAHSTIALVLTFLLRVFFQVSTIFYGIDILSMNMSDAKQTHMILDLTLATSLSLISFVCINLVNVYFLSACLEMLFPKAHGAKRYVICAVIGTMAYLYLEITGKLGMILLAENVIAYSMAILVVSLLVNFLISLAVRHRTHYSSHFLGSVSWLIGCIVAIRSLLLSPESPNEALVFGVIATLLFSIATIFIEETVWSVKGVIARSRA